MVEIGLFYGILIDPLLKSVRKRVASHINPDEHVIDIACGTGAQAFQMALKGNKVVGVDLSPSMINFAKKRRDKPQTHHVDFVVADAVNLVQFTENAFDVAAMTLALHQFSPDLYTPILSEMKRVAQRIVIVDYAVPLQTNLAGYACKVIEFMAGREHNRCFREYYKAGGLEAVLPRNGIKIQKKTAFGGGAFNLLVCTAV